MSRLLIKERREVARQHEQCLPWASRAKASRGKAKEQRKAQAQQQTTIRNISRLIDVLISMHDDLASQRQIDVLTNRLIRAAQKRRSPAGRPAQPSTTNRKENYVTATGEKRHP